MKLEVLKEKILQLQGKRKELKEVSEIARVCSDPGDLKYLSASVSSNWVSIPIKAAAIAMKSTVADLRAQCKNLAQEIDVEHEELPLEGEE